MVNFSKSLLLSSLSTLITIIISFLLLGFVDAHPKTYWGLQVIAIVIISVIFTFYLDSYLDVLIYGLIQGIATFTLFFAFLMLFSSFSELLLNLLNFGITIISGWNNIQRSFVGAILAGLIITGIALSISFLTYYILTLIDKSSNLSTHEVEEKYYSKYETSSTSGRYHRLDDKEKFE